MLTAILWWGRINDLSCRLLTDTFRAIHPSQSVRIHAFAAAARDLFRHTLGTLLAYHKGRHRGGCFRLPSRHRLPASCIPESGRLREELSAAIVGLRNDARLRPCVTLVPAADAGGHVKDAMSAMLGMTDSMADFLQQVLPPLAWHVGRNAVRAFILETRAEIDELAVRMDHQLYTESLTVTRMSAKSVCVELEACLGSTTPGGSSL